jgi:hypothetical protein
MPKPALRFRPLFISLSLSLIAWPALASMDYLEWHQLNTKGEELLSTKQYAEAEQCFRQAIKFSEAKPYGGLTACELLDSYTHLLTTVKKQQKLSDYLYCYRGILFNSFCADVFLLDPYLLWLIGSVLLIVSALSVVFVRFAYRAYANKKIHARRAVVDPAITELLDHPERSV